MVERLVRNHIWQLDPLGFTSRNSPTGSAEASREAQDREREREANRRAPDEKERENTQ